MKDALLLSPQYESEFKRRHGKEPKYIPIDLKSNFNLPEGVEVKQQFSRVWTSNRKARYESR